jgi:hypothetical protein
MSAFEHVMSLISFVFALAIAHLLTCAIGIFRARARVRFSFTHASWMIISLLQVTVWWLAFWDFRLMKSWDVGYVVFTLLAGILVYVYTGLVCPEVPKEGPLDLQEYHRTHGREYIAVYLALGVVGFVYGAIYGYFYNVPEQTAQNAVVAPMTLIALVALIFRNRTMQTVCAAAMLALYPVYLYVGQHPLQ